jgi:hypothetical protein
MKRIYRRTATKGFPDLLSIFFHVISPRPPAPSNVSSTWYPSAPRKSGPAKVDDVFRLTVAAATVLQTLGSIEWRKIAAAVISVIQWRKGEQSGVEKSGPVYDCNRFLKAHDEISKSITNWSHHSVNSYTS